VWGANTARPGSVNYVEGQVTLNGAPLNSTSIGVAEVQPGQMLETQQGKAEMLLTPGVFIRLDDNSRLKMINPSLIDTRVELVHGKAMLEVTELMKENHIVVLDAGATTTVEKRGLYEFDANNPRVSVYDGEALVTADDKQIKLKKGRETALTGRLHAQKFDRKYEDSLYAWSNVRSETLSQASTSYARAYVGGGWGYPGWGYPGWYGAGWYWNPWFDMYSFIPGDGIFYSPFGWGFYSPGFIGYAPLYYGGVYYGGHYLRGGHYNGHGTQWAHGRVPAYRGSSGGAVAPHAHAFTGGHGSFGGGAFRGGGGFRGGFGGGGFHGGGFHGGGRR
ncbi:MAG TPA: FecR domain-containing protein, partial [Bryobacteraceae bacterium]|nr:FecR domain-containing protein [Bryobacteraceae bacterium]